MDEPYYIPGFTEKLLGAQVGNTREFILPFPADHYQKLYAGKDINFKVTVTKIETRTLPEINDAFAQKLGTENLEKMRETIVQNLQEEADRKSHEAAEIEMLKEVVAATTFGEIPDTLVEAERRKILQELQQNLKQHGISVQQYLSDLKKSPEELEAGFTDQAIERAKMGLLTLELARQEKIDVTPEELQEELEAIRASYKGNPDAIKRLLLPEIQELVLTSLRNRKVVGYLAEQIIGKE
jgi:trigger factor